MNRLLWIALAVSPAFAQTPFLDDILARVAANQAKSVEARKQYVYRQDELVGMHHNKKDCEQRREYTVTPTANGMERRLVQPAAKTGDVSRCNVHLSNSSGETLSVSTDSADTSGESDAFSMSLGKAPDGMPRGLFPLTAEEQRFYRYRLAGTETVGGRKVYRIAFLPGKEGIWKGEALIDAEEFQPVQVVTDLTAKVPLAVRILLGTNVHGLGFTVSYQRMPDGVWFPASFGGEFEVRALFFWKETVSINVKNSDFRHTDVNSKIAFEGN